MLKMVLNKIKRIITFENKKEYEFLIANILHNGISNALYFDYERMKRRCISFVNSMRLETFYKYKFAPSQKKENIYSSVYACLLLDMYGEIENLSESQKEEWAEYFDSFQREDDGLWYDKNLLNQYYYDSDWWGARHLAVHIIVAYAALGRKPKYKIRSVEKYYDLNYTKSWLDRVNWNEFFGHNNDIDNKLMNIMSILQYNRDFYGDENANRTLEFIYNYLDSKTNPITGMWGKCNIEDPYQLSRTAQFAYHILMAYFYDKREIKYKERIVELTLRTQNKLGGYGVKLNSSACEDMDSIELLLHLGRKDDNRVQDSLKKALAWVLSNQNEDGGFVFRRNEPLWYGHTIMSSQKNESNMFATWFRTLSIAKIVNYFENNSVYNIKKIPGYYS